MVDDAMVCIPSGFIISRSLIAAPKRGTTNSLSIVTSFYVLVFSLHLYKRVQCLSSPIEVAS